MRRFLDIDTSDDFQRARIIQFILMLTTFFLCFLIRGHERTFFTFSFMVEFLILIVLFNFYFQAQKNRNYAYWGITFFIGVYLLRAILQYTFMEYNALIIYFSFLSMIFLGINVYIMSSPIFYPRVQWWEYDYRYRGDLKAITENENESFESRLTDLRRDSGCIELFEPLEVGSKISVTVEHDGKKYQLPAIVKTRTQIIPGRPLRYGIKIDYIDNTNKNDFVELKRKWNETNRVKLRKKFSEIKNGIDT
jgi:hypothetical protein